MRGRLFSSILVASALVGGALGSEVSAASPTTPRETYVIVFKDGVNANTEANRLKGQGFQVRFTYQSLFPGVAVDLPPEAVAGFQRNPIVAIMEKDGVVTASDVQSNPPWGLDRIDQRSLPLDGSYSYPSTGGQGVRAYIVDTGILSSHVDFGGRVVSGYTAIADGGGTKDCNGHGTHVAGTVGGAKYGVAKKVTLVPVRVLGCNGSGSLSGVVAGLDWIRGEFKGRPSVANLSLGSSASSTVNAAVKQLHDAGVTVVVAAGNSTADACNFSPAGEPTAVTVGATTSSDAAASYSNYGSCLDIFAPGSSITSAWHTSNTAINTISGTSMASPHVAGVVARLLSANPSLTPSMVASNLASTASANRVSTLSTDSPLLLYVDPPIITDVVISTTSLPNATQYSSYSTVLSASGGDGTSYSWSATGLPAGLTLSGATISGNPSVFGTFTVGLTATSGGRSASTSLTLTVAQSTALPLPGSFSKSSPVNGAQKISRSPLLTWTSSSNATSYQVCISTIQTCSTWTSVGSGTSYTPPLLASNKTFYWQVRAVNSTGTVTASDGTWSFKTVR